MARSMLVWGIALLMVRSTRTTGNLLGLVGMLCVGGALLAPAAVSARPITPNAGELCLAPAEEVFLAKSAPAVKKLGTQNEMSLALWPRKTMDVPVYSGFINL